MGVLCHPIRECILREKKEELPIQSQRIAQLFKEYYRRYKELRLARRLETLYFIFSVTTGLLTLLLPWYFSSSRGILLSGVFLAFFYISIRKYLYQSKLVMRINLNVNILYHHLMGKLEIGFCSHTEPCNCVHDFRKFVWDNYHLSLYEESK